MNKQIFFALFFVLLSTTSFAENVGIGTIDKNKTQTWTSEEAIVESSVTNDVMAESGRKINAVNLWNSDNSVINSNFKQN